MNTFAQVPALLQPQPLQANQQIGIIAAAGKVAAQRVELAIRTFEHWGLKVVLGQHVFSEYNTFAGTDAQRIADLQAMLDNPDIRAVISARGGYGVSRIVDRIDFTSLLRQPKWLVGFSDITVLHCHLHRLGLESLHAAMPVTFNYAGAESSIETLRKALFGESIQYSIHPEPINRLGKATGQLIGGNLSLLVHLIGTASDVDTTGKILFIEDIGEYVYHLDRMMVQMKRAGKLSGLAGLIVGQMTDIQDKPGDTPFGKTSWEIIYEAVADYQFPVCFHFPVGHEAVNWALPCGRMTTLCVSAEQVSLTCQGAGVQ
ncbi:MAG: LD-carboxypeptidase [Bacteroidota bacterium]